MNLVHANVSSPSSVNAALTPTWLSLTRRMLSGLNAVADAVLAEMARRGTAQPVREWQDRVEAPAHDLLAWRSSFGC